MAKTQQLTFQIIGDEIIFFAAYWLSKTQIAEDKFNKLRCNANFTAVYTTMTAAEKLEFHDNLEEITNLEKNQGQQVIDDIIKKSEQM